MKHCSHSLDFKEKATKWWMITPLNSFEHLALIFKKIKRSLSSHSFLLLILGKNFYSWSSCKAAGYRCSSAISDTKCFHPYSGGKKTHTQKKKLGFVNKRHCYGVLLQSCPLLSFITPMCCYNSGRLFFRFAAGVEVPSAQLCTVATAIFSVPSPLPGSPSSVDPSPHRCTK